MRSPSISVSVSPTDKPRNAMPLAPAANAWPKPWLRVPEPFADRLRKTSTTFV